MNFQMFTCLLQTKALCTVSPEAYIAAASARTGVCNCACLARARASFMRVSVVRRVCVRARPSVRFVPRRHSDAKVARKKYE